MCDIQLLEINFPYSVDQNPNLRQKQNRTSMLWKNENELFSSLYIACKHRNANLAEFFSHENQQHSPAISLHGKPRQSTKPEIIKPLQKGQTTILQEPQVQAKIIDGAYMTNILRPGSEICKSFDDYANKVFVPHIIHFWKCRSGGCCLGLLYRQQPQRFHEGAPWQRNQTQSIWGKLTSSKLAKFPESQWKQDRAIHIPCNKTDFFKVTCRQGDCINQWGQCIIQPSPWTESNITPCNHEEADSRIFVHAADCAKQGISKILVSSVDSDVVVHQS